MGIDAGEREGQWNRERAGDPLLADETVPHGSGHHFFHNTLDGLPDFRKRGDPLVGCVEDLRSANTHHNSFLRVKKRVPSNETDSLIVAVIETFAP